MFAAATTNNKNVKNGQKLFLIKCTANIIKNAITWNVEILGLRLNTDLTRVSKYTNTNFNKII